MNRFVILRHETPDDSDRKSHWDLMLEADDGLWTWAVDELPGPNPQTATRLANHRAAYLTYEGEISHNRGSVTQHDAGTVEWLTNQTEQIVVQLTGTKTEGRLTLNRLAENWSVDLR